MQDNPASILSFLACTSSLEKQRGTSSSERGPIRLRSVKIGLVNDGKPIWDGDQSMRGGGRTNDKASQRVCSRAGQGRGHTHTTLAIDTTNWHRLFVSELSRNAQSNQIFHMWRRCCGSVVHVAEGGQEVRKHLKKRRGSGVGAS